MEEELFDSTVSHHGVGTAIEIVPQRGAQGYMVVIPIRMHGISLGRGARITAYDSFTQISLGTTVISDDVRISGGLDGKFDLGIGVHTPGKIMLYGMGVGEVSATLLANGLTDNQLGFALGPEAGFAIAEGPAIVMFGGLAQGQASILDPRGDFAELDMGARARMAVRDRVYARIEGRESVARTVMDSTVRAGEIHVDYKLSPAFRPWTPALKVLVGLDGRIQKVERGPVGESDYYGGVHLVFYKE